MAEAINVLMSDETHRFEVTLAGETAFAEYLVKDAALELPHTVVPAAFEGKGVGSLLAKTALSYARDRGLSVKPLCPFIASYIKKHPQWQDLVDEAFRQELGPGA